jgi:hypothetical protein
MLWSSLLFIWELVGIDLEKAKETGGNAGAIITAIKSPQAIPWVLLILVIYFVFKTTVEWYQNNVVRRSLRASRVDFASGWIVALIAVGLYIAQTIARAQLADVVQARPGTAVQILVGIVGGSATFAGVKFILNAEVDWSDPLDLVAIFLGPVILITGYIAHRWFGLQVHWPTALTAIAIGVLVQFALRAVRYGLLRWRLRGIELNLEKLRNAEKTS